MKKKNDYRVRFKLGDSEVEVEGAETGVVRIVEALADVLRGTRKVPPAVSVGVPSAAPVSRSSPADIRSFFKEKQPSSDVEAAAVTAYFYQYLADEGSRLQSIDSKTLQDAFRLAKRPLPAKTIFTLQNARNAGYLDSTGEAGQFRLNSVGYNLVEHTLGPSESDEEPERRAGKTPRKRAGS